MIRFIGDTIWTVAFLSPPLLVFFIWKNFLKASGSHDSGWKLWIDWIAVSCTSTFFLVCLVAAFVIPQDVNKDNWASVVKWRAFTGDVVVLAPFLVLLAVLGRKKTRLLSVLLIVAVVLDCMGIQAMA